MSPRSTPRFGKASNIPSERIPKLDAKALRIPRRYVAKNQILRDSNSFFNTIETPPAPGNQLEDSEVPSLFIADEE